MLAWNIKTAITQKRQWENVCSHHLLLNLRLSLYFLSQTYQITHLGTVFRPCWTPLDGPHPEHYHTYDFCSWTDCYCEKLPEAPKTNRSWSHASTEGKLGTGSHCRFGYTGAGVPIDTRLPMTMSVLMPQPAPLPRPPFPPQSPFLAIPPSNYICILCFLSVHSLQQAYNKG